MMKYLLERISELGFCDKRRRVDLNEKFPYLSIRLFLRPVVLLAIVSATMMSLTFKVDGTKPDIETLKANDSPDLIKTHSKMILNYIRRKHMDSKIRCFENNDANKRIAKLKLFAPVDSYFFSHKENKQAGRRDDVKGFLTLKVYKKSNSIFLKDIMLRYRLYHSVGLYPCYVLNDYNSELENKYKDTCSKYIANTLSDYRVIEVIKGEGVMSKNHYFGIYGLLDEYHCSRSDVVNTKYFPEYEKSFFMVCAVNNDKPHLLLGDDFCQSSNDWKVFYSLFQNDKRIQSDSALKHYAWAFYLRMFVREKFDAQYNPIIELDSLLVDTRKNTLTAIAKNIGYQGYRRSLNVPRKDLLLTMDIGTGVINYKTIK